MSRASTRARVGPGSTLPAKTTHAADSPSQDRLSPAEDTSWLPIGACKLTWPNLLGRVASASSMRCCLAALLPAGANSCAWLDTWPRSMPSDASLYDAYQICLHSLLLVGPAHQLLACKTAMLMLASRAAHLYNSVCARCCQRQARLAAFPPCIEDAICPGMHLTHTQE